MASDERSPLYFAYLSLFVFAMLGLVASASLFFVCVYWELVGLCSYLLIGFWRDRKANSDAADKAFIVNRVGDVGMLLGLGLLWTQLGTVDLATINRSIRDTNGHFHAVETAAGTAYQLQEPGDKAQPLLNGLGKPDQSPLGFWRWRGSGFSPVRWARAPSSPCTFGFPTQWPDQLLSPR